MAVLIGRSERRINAALAGRPLGLQERRQELARAGAVVVFSLQQRAMAPWPAWRLLSSAHGAHLANDIAPGANEMKPRTPRPFSAVISV